MSVPATEPVAPGAASARPGGGISRRVVLLLAVVCGAAVANLYYAQPLLHTLSGAFGVSTATSGLLVTVGQVGYVIGLALVVPAGDLLERRRLITLAMLVTAAAMAGCALAPGFAAFAAATAVVGVSCVAAQVVVPMASSLAPPAERGRVVGTVMSGLLIGILLARTFSGVVAAALGWRVVFWIGAAIMLVLAGVLRRALPRVAPAAELGYGRALRSVLALVAAEPVLRRRMLLGAMAFGCFSTLWTSLSFLLAGAPFHYGNAVIGLFGLAGIAGAGAATVVGRAADRGHGRWATWASCAVLLTAWALLYAGRRDVVVLIVGIAVLDLGAQGLHIANQHAIYALAPEARSRLTTAYMVAYFAGGAILSAVTSSLYAADGWAAVCALGAATGLTALLSWAAMSRLPGRPRWPPRPGGRGAGRRGAASSSSPGRRARRR